MCATSPLRTTQDARPLAHDTCALPLTPTLRRTALRVPRAPAMKLSRPDCGRRASRRSAPSPMSRQGHSELIPGRREDGRGFRTSGHRLLLFDVTQVGRGRHMCAEVRHPLLDLAYSRHANCSCAGLAGARACRRDRAQWTPASDARSRPFQCIGRTTREISDDGDMLQTPRGCRSPSLAFAAHERSPPRHARKAPRMRPGNAEGKSVLAIRRAVQRQTRRAVKARREARSWRSSLW